MDSFTRMSVLQWVTLASCPHGECSLAVAYAELKNVSANLSGTAARRHAMLSMMTELISGDDQPYRQIVDKSAAAPVALIRCAGHGVR